MVFHVASNGAGRPSNRRSPSYRIRATVDADRRFSLLDRRDACHRYQWPVGLNSPMKPTRIFFRPAAIPAIPRERASNDRHGTGDRSLGAGKATTSFARALPKRVRVEFNGAWIADSTRAIILHETRAPPMHYFPAEDVRMDCLVRTPTPNALPVQGQRQLLVAQGGGQGGRERRMVLRGSLPRCRADPRLPVVLSQQDLSPVRRRRGSGVPAQSAAMPCMATRSPAWLIEEAWKARSPEALMGEFCGFLRSAGYPIARSTIIIPTLHPQIFATVLVWRDDVADVSVVFEPHDILLQPRFADSPFAPIIRGAGGVRRRLEDDDVKLDFPVVRDLKIDGATDYVAMPFRFSDGQINVISMTSFRKGGFSTAHLGNIYEVMPALGRMFEVHAQRRISVGLLETYLGRSTGKRVLEGQIKHGDGQLIHAVIWFCDLRNSTNLAASMDTATYLSHLNRFLGAMAGAIIDHGGEILAYIGDAVLAIFPIADAGAPSAAEGVASPGDDAPSAAGYTPADACARAIQAARASAQRIATANSERPDMPALHYGIGLHVGDVTYGNIGIPQRLQFTVIGSAANEASRIEGMTKDLGEPVLVSSRFAELYPGELCSRGSHALKGVAGTHELFGLRPYAISSRSAPADRARRRHPRHYSLRMRDRRCRTRNGRSERSAAGRRSRELRYRSIGGGREWGIPARRISSAYSTKPAPE